jgi:hypothetical protein
MKPLTQKVRQTDKLIQKLIASFIVMMINGSNPVKKEPYHSHISQSGIKQILLQLSRLTY